ncbi:MULTISPECIES: hypothetical protein [unclassified Neorhizobium]|uniref:hypothetical protein n=1 Tax=unclassified Neorhizobium TaxID=2629175 RepID=UPI001FE18B54|nr:MULTISPECIES: hypothetical protein [unclassified Neorhizobium]
MPIIGLSCGGRNTVAPDRNIDLAAVARGSIWLGVAMAFIAIVATTLLPLLLATVLRRSGLVAKQLSTIIALTPFANAKNRV